MIGRDRKLGELEKLEGALFMLEMADRWEAEDYRIANELRDKIKKLKEENNGESNFQRSNKN